MSNFLDNEFGFSSLGGGGGSASEGDITGVGFADEVAFFFGETEIEGNNFLFFRPTLVRLSIGDSAVATQTLDVTGTTKATSFTIVSGGTFTSPGAGNINISSNLGIGVTVGTNPTQTLDVAGSITTSTDLDLHIDGFSTLLNEIYSIGRINFPETNSLTINSRSAIIFGEGSASLGGSQTMLLYDTGNLVIQNGGVFSDTGERLKVVGNVLVNTANLDVTNSSNSVLRGSGATGGSQVLRITNSAAELTYLFRNDTRWYFGNNGNLSPHITVSSIAGVNILFRVTGSDPTDHSLGLFNFSTEGDMIQASGSANVVDIDCLFAPTSGSGAFINLYIQTSLNQTGGANGSSRGIYINPTLTNAADFRALEIGSNVSTPGTRYQFWCQGTADIFVNNDAHFEFGTGTGSVIATVTSQRISFWNKPTVARQTTAVVGAVYVAVGGGNIQVNDTFDAYKFAQLVLALRTIGFLA